MYVNEWRHEVGTKKVACLVGIAVLATAAILSGCGSTEPSAPPDKQTASAETTAYVDNAMPVLESIMDLWMDGKYQAAADLWKAMGNIPVVNAADDVLADAYLEYANNVRYWMIDDGSANMKDVETSREKAEAVLAELRDPDGTVYE